MAATWQSKVVWRSVVSAHIVGRVFDEVLHALVARRQQMGERLLALLSHEVLAVGDVLLADLAASLVGSNCGGDLSIIVQPRESVGNHLSRVVIGQTHVIRVRFTFPGRR